MYSSLAVVSPRGAPATLAIRPGTNDSATLHSTFRFDGRCTDEYGLADFYTEGWVLDIGAHIGSVALAVALDNPRASVIAVEAVPENVAVLRENVSRIGASDHIFVLPMAAAKAGTAEVAINYGRADESRYIGNLTGSDATTVTVPAVSLDDIIDGYGIDFVDLLKIDCEGCEWAFLDSRAIDRVRRITGEYHNDDPGRLIGLLGDTHQVTVSGDGAFGLFSAQLRPTDDSSGMFDRREWTDDPA